MQVFSTNKYKVVVSFAPPPPFHILVEFSSLGKILYKSAPVYTVCYLQNKNFKTIYG